MYISYRLGAVFCHPIKYGEEELQKQARYHTKAQPLDDICDNTVLPKRPCTIFGGSGKYATLNMAGKGGTATLDGVKSLSTISDESLDVLIWDYSLNDVANGMDIFHKAVVQSFFQQGHLKRAFICMFIYNHIYIFIPVITNMCNNFGFTALDRYPNISAVAMVFWQDDTDGLSLQCKSRGHVAWSNDLSTADYPFIKSRFDPVKGSMGNISFISSSLPQFCHAANCSLNDIVQANTAHPKDSGISLFADLFIWQLLHYFKKLLRNQCKDLKDEIQIRNTNYTSAGDRDNIWVVDAHSPLLPYTSRFKADVQKFSTDLPQLLKNPTRSYRSVARLIFYSPQIASPLPVDQYAYLCTPGKVFDPNTVTKPVWTSVNIVSIMKRGCAGWMNSGFRDEMRADDNHMYLPASTARCPAAGWPANKATLQALTKQENPQVECPPPFWPNNNSYPYLPWKDDSLPPNVKPVDLLFRISTNLDWDHLCYDSLPCNPKMIWKDKDTGSWKSDNLYGHNDQFDMKCYEKLQEAKTGYLLGDFIYLHLVADECLPWHVFEHEKWHPSKLEETISLIKSFTFTSPGSNYTSL